MPVCPEKSCSLVFKFLTADETIKLLCYGLHASRQEEFIRVLEENSVAVIKGNLTLPEEASVISVADDFAMIVTAKHLEEAGVYQTETEGEVKSVLAPLQKTKFPYIYGRL